MHKALFSSDPIEWRTLKQLFDHWNRLFGFDIDVCASDENHLCAKYYTANYSCLESSIEENTEINQKA